MADLHRRIADEIVRAAAATAGPGAAATLQSRGLAAFHTVVDAVHIGGIRDRVLDTVRQDLLRLAAAVGREVMGWTDDFYVDDYLILRINFPYDEARKADPRAENPGIGRLSPQVRDVAKSRKVTDVVYAPKGYHQNQPPASWAHGPHVDSWSGHSRDGVNLWWAITDVPPEAGMALYPELSDRQLRCDRRSLYLAAGYPLPKPTFVPLAAGEMFVFDPECLHSTSLNTTSATRVAVSARLNAAKPTFDAACFYAREFWHTASNVEAGHCDRVMHLRREDHLAPDRVMPLPEPPPPVPVVRIGAPATPGPVRVCAAHALPQGSRMLVEFSDCRVLMVHTASGIRAFIASCPHVGADLTDGAIDDHRIYCPGHATAFDLHDGSSACASLTLQMWNVRREGSECLLIVPASRS